jgi:hypothetical protein
MTGSKPFIWDEGLMRAYSWDEPLMRVLGLRTTGFEREWTDLGTVTVEEAEPEGEYGPRPAATVKVEVLALPAQFWRFTVTRPRDEAETVDGEVRGIYEPVEIRVITTGSGSFSEYWPSARLVASHCLNVEVVVDAEQWADRVAACIDPDPEPTRG